MVQNYYSISSNLIIRRQNYFKPIIILAIHLTLLIFCNIINPQCPRAFLPVSYLQFHSITYPLVLVLFVSLLREFGTP